MKNRKFLACILTAFVMVFAFTAVIGVSQTHTAVFAEEDETPDNAEAGGNDTAADNEGGTEKAENADAKEGTEENADEEEQPTTFWGKYGSLIVMILVYGGLFFLLWLVLIKPQQKKRKQEEEMRASLMLGDSVTTIGGIVGRVVKIQDDEVTIETSIDRSLLTFKNWAVRDIKHVESEEN